MKSDTWRYTVYLHHGDAEQAVCIGALEKILERIKTGELRERYSLSLRRSQKHCTSILVEQQKLRQV